jgi:hypothetical protein
MLRLSEQLPAPKEDSAVFEVPSVVTLEMSVAVQ